MTLGNVRIAVIRGKQRALTLIEVLLVISLLGLLAAFAWPSFGSAARTEQLDESARRIKSLIAMCRAQAMNDALRYRITIRLDGSIKLRRQFDPIEGPHVFVPVRANWNRLAFLLQEVWVESVALLPDGPPPILIDDEIEQFEDMEDDFEPLPIEDYDQPIHILFEPDGTSDSLLWVLRDEMGHGFQMTLDGRIGRITVELVDPIPEDTVARPPEIDLEEELDEEREAWDEVGWKEPKP